MPPRRTEHCWPVARTLEDLLPLIPDPAVGPEPGTMIQRLMLEPVRNQFIVELAERYHAAGWTVLYLVANAWRGAEVEDTGIRATVISAYGGDWLERVQREIGYIEEEGGKALVVTEVLDNGAEPHHHLVAIPRAVATLDPVPCPHCGEPVFASWHKAQRQLQSSCNANSHKEWARSLHAVTSPPKGQGRGEYSRQDRTPAHRKQPWTAEQEALARQLRAEGLTWQQMADRMGRTHLSVRNFLRSGGMAGVAARQQSRARLQDIGF